MVHRGRGGMLGRQAPGRRARCRRRAGARGGRGVCAVVALVVFRLECLSRVGGSIPVAQWRWPSGGACLVQLESVRCCRTVRTPRRCRVWREGSLFELLSFHTAPVRSGPLFKVLLHSMMTNTLTAIRFGESDA